MKTRECRSIMLFEKQFEFIDKLHSILHKLNCYITEIDVWLGETGKSARKAVKGASKKNACVFEFDRLLDCYYAYISKDLMVKVQELSLQANMLNNIQTQEATGRCVDLLFSLRNDIREYVQGKK